MKNLVVDIESGPVFDSKRNLFGCLYDLKSETNLNYGFLLGIQISKIYSPIQNIENTNNHTIVHRPILEYRLENGELKRIGYTDHRKERNKNL